MLVDGALGERELATLANHAACTQLSISNIALADLSCVQLLPKLEALEIAGGSVADWSALAKVRTLRRLVLNGVACGEALPPEIGKLRSLTVLSLLHLRMLSRLDLAGCKALAKVSVWGCRRLRDLSGLSRLPALREVVLVDTPHEPSDLKSLLGLPQLRHLAAQFGDTRQNQQFAALLAEHGKTRYPEAK